MKRPARPPLTVTIGTLRVPANYDVRELGSRIERELADRRFGLGGDPLAATIAAHIGDAVDRTGETA